MKVTKVGKAMGKRPTNLIELCTFTLFHINRLSVLRLNEASKPSPQVVYVPKCSRDAAQQVEHSVWWAADAGKTTWSSKGFFLLSSRFSSSQFSLQCRLPYTVTVFITGLPPPPTQSLPTTTSTTIPCNCIH